MRRAFVVLLLIAIALAIGWWLWSWRSVSVQRSDPWVALPEATLAVLELPEPTKVWGRFAETSQFWNDLEEEPLFVAIDTILHRMGDGGEVGSILIVWEEQEPAPLLIHPLVASEAALATLQRALGPRVSGDLWQGQLLELPADTALPALYMAWKQGSLLLGTTVEQVKRAYDRKADKPLPLLEKARASFSIGADARLLIKPATAAGLLDREQGGGLFPGATPRGGWLAMDIRLRPEAVLMSGMLFPGPADSSGLAALRHQQPMDLQVAQVLPATITALRAAQVTDARSFIEGITGKAPDQGRFAAYGEWIHGAVALATQAGEEHRQWAAFGTEDPGAASRALEERCPDGGCPTTSYRDVRITRVADPHAMELFGGFLGSFEQPLWALLGNVVVVAETPAAMRAAIDAWTDRNSLALAPNTAEFFGRYSTRAAYTWWADVPAAYPPAAKLPGVLQRTLAGVLVQLTARPDGTFMATACLQHGGTAKRTDGALWTTALPAPLEQHPRLVKDYLSRTLQVLAQDSDHRISLISCTGKLLWQRQLDGPIKGEVQQVDRYKNDKLQLLFNTDGKVYLIDRLGRDVEGFPVKLKNPASAPLSVFDYEGNKDYRIVVPLANGNLLNLAPNGRPVQGWEPEVLDGPAAAPVEHLRIRGKDYLVVVRQDGGVNVLDRRGNERYRPKLHMAGFKELLASRQAMSIAECTLTWADSSGAVVRGTLGGAVDTLSTAASGRVLLVTGTPDGRDAVVRVAGNGLAAELDGKALFRVNFPDARQAEAFAIHLPGAPDAIGLALPEQDQVRLYDAEGTLWPGFPLKGAVRFVVADINLDGILELVTADADGMLMVYPLPGEP